MLINHRLSKPLPAVPVPATSLRLSEVGKNASSTELWNIQSCPNLDAAFVQKNFHWKATLEWVSYNYSYIMYAFSSLCWFLQLCIIFLNHFSWQNYWTSES